jgi:catechol 2,3-dioxygenase-like lactoylglutathione lyase family enzyme
MRTGAKPLQHAILGIDHVQLAAPPASEAAACKFFGELLGMQELAKPASLQSRGGVWFQCGGQQLHIGIEADFQPNRKAHPALAVRNLVALRLRLQAAGIKITEDNALPGAQRIYVEDPFGNRLELLESP